MPHDPKSITPARCPSGWTRTFSDDRSVCTKHGVVVAGGTLRTRRQASCTAEGSKRSAIAPPLGSGGHASDIHAMKLPQEGSEVQRQGVLLGGLQFLEAIAADPGHDGPRSLERGRWLPDHDELRCRRAGGWTGSRQPQLFVLDGFDIVVGARQADCQVVAEAEDPVAAPRIQAGADGQSRQPGRLFAHQFVSPGRCQACGSRCAPSPESQRHDSTHGLNRASHFRGDPIWGCRAASQVGAGCSSPLRSDSSRGAAGQVFGASDDLVARLRMGRVRG